MTIDDRHSTFSQDPEGLETGTGPSSERLVTAEDFPPGAATTSQGHQSDTSSDGAGAALR